MKYTAYIDKRNGDYIVPTAHTYNGMIYCYIFSGNMFNYHADYYCAKYISPEHISKSPITITCNEDLTGLNYYHTMIA